MPGPATSVHHNRSLTADEWQAAIAIGYTPTSPGLLLTDSSEPTGQGVLRVGIRTRPQPGASPSHHHTCGYSTAVTWCRSGRWYMPDK